MVRDLRIEHFLETLGSGAPVPGGGGASALAGAFGTSLGMMVLNLTIGKRRYEEIREELEALLSHLTELREIFYQLADKDEEVFLPLSKAYGMPKNTPEEALVKDAFMQQALYDATVVPLSMMETAVSALEDLKTVAEKGSRLAISDAGVAVSFLRTALDGASYNVKINIRSMKDEQTRAGLQDRMERLLAYGGTLASEITEIVGARI
ncbi:MAG: cyclodeaminase/cyclohydrolase family protein [Lachnospiraceae bacterium]|nr:cyclodeaminase/cyclohydrolase family protein [Lachnospiraceae bacterium]MBP5255155.1 cyclodeaminase/cyclohydrolase family protein [Lachnospiraceae bacterium]